MRPNFYTSSFILCKHCLAAIVAKIAKLGSCSAAVAACIFSLGFPFLASSRGGRLQLALRVLRHPEEVRQLPAVRRQGTWQRPRGPRLPGGERSRSFVIPGTPAASSTPEKLMRICSSVLHSCISFIIRWNILKCITFG